MLLPTTQTTTMHSSSASGSSSSSKVPAATDLRKGTNQLQTAVRERRVALPAAALAAAVVDVCLAAVSLAGAALLAWWAVAFHPSYARLWMVPVGLVLACTPVVVLAALHLSPAAAGDDARAPPLSAVVVVDKY